jgi:glycosyltransferase involved in cell wall biosynthesis
MKIAIYNHGIAFDANTPLNQPLGGSETSIVCMAAELSRCGHHVTVYCNFSSSTDSQRSIPKADAPAYKHYHQFFNEYVSMPWDAVISFRSFDPFLLGRIAPRMIFWCGDAFDQPALKNFEHPSLQENIDFVFCVSEWHRQTFIKAFQLPPDKVIATRNGFTPALVRRAPIRDWARSAYSSTPFRGLDILLKMFPEIRRPHPNVSLDLFSSMKVYGWSSDEDQRAFGSLYESAKQPGVKWHGSVSQPVLLKHLASSGLFLYPNTFDETSCMAAIEAQASGCVVVTSAKAALIETVEHGHSGICIKGDPKSEPYQREFISTVCSLLENPERMEEFSRNARERAFQKYTWSSIAWEWTAILENMQAAQVHARWSGPLSLLQKTQTYLQNGNVNAATRVLTALAATPFFRNEVERLTRSANAIACSNKER